MRKRIKPLVVFVFFVSFIAIILGAKHYSENKETKQQKDAITQTSAASQSTDTSDSDEADKAYKPIIDLSGWQLPSDINYDVLAKMFLAPLYACIAEHKQKKKMQLHT